MTCKFCSGSMKPCDTTARVLVCDSCGYFVSEKRTVYMMLYGASMPKAQQEYSTVRHSNGRPFPFSTLAGGY